MALWEDGLQYGTRAAQPLASAVGESIVYVVTDEGVIEQNQGGTWTQIGIATTAGLDFGETGDIVTQAFGDAADAGATGEVADAGHTHGMPVNPVTAHAGSATAHGTAVDDLADVDAAAPTDGQVLVWDDYQALWVPAAQSGSSSGGTLHTDLSVSGATNVDRDDGATHDLTLTGDATLTPIATTVTTGKAIDMRWLVRQDGVGGHTLAIAGTVTWVGGSAPTMPSGADEMMTVGLVSVDDATTWLGYFDRVGTGLTNPMTTEGDIVYSSDGSGTPARLAAGSDGEVLTLASGVPSWAAAGGGGVTGSEAFLTSPVSLAAANTYYDGPSQSLTGTYLLLATAVAKSATAPVFLTVRLWDGSTVYAEGEVYLTLAGGTGTITLSALVSGLSATTVKLSAAQNSVSGGAGTLLDQTVLNGTADKATKLVWVKIA